MVTSFPWETSPQVRPGGEKHRRRKFGQEVVREVKVEIKAGQVAPFLLLNLVDMKRGEDHAPFGVVGMRQGEKALGEQILVPDLVRARGAKLLPGHARRQFDAHAFLDGFAPRHRHARGGAVAQIVARGEEIQLALHDLGLRGLHARQDRGEVLFAVHGHVTGPLLARVLGGGALEDAHAEEEHRSQEPSCGDDRGCAVSHLWSSFLSGSGILTL